MIFLLKAWAIVGFAGTAVLLCWPATKSEIEQRRRKCSAGWRRREPSGSSSH